MEYYVNNTDRWGQVLWLENNHAKIGVALEFGLRIVHLSRPNEKNLFYVQPEDLSDGYTTKSGWKLYGGHRLWLSPESSASCCPDNAPVSYEIEGNRVRIRQQPDPQLGVCKAITITMDEDKVELEHCIENVADTPLTGASWGVNTLAGNGHAFIRFANGDGPNFTPHRSVSLWGNTNLHDPRIRFTADSLSVCHQPLPEYFKIGLHCTEGIAVYENFGQRLTITFPTAPMADLPDNGCNFALYMCRHFMELETMGTVHTLQTGERMSHKEWWSLAPAQP